ncbi:hypothetical protein EVAR_65627_1 [Eumeta japonica]|uniref:Uncharacterized protein n=1 Tax=Eumeta variegata TaxID=151549 RepID=A0A4C1Z9E7_EUMVA|nr:hypothetical protein EVAR_65627_1 [Eumeta japonica]
MRASARAGGGRPRRSDGSSAGVNRVRAGAGAPRGFCLRPSPAESAGGRHCPVRTLANDGRAPPRGSSGTSRRRATVGTPRLDRTSLWSLSSFASSCRSSGVDVKSGPEEGHGGCSSRTSDSNETGPSCRARLIRLGTAWISTETLDLLGSEDGAGRGEGARGRTSHWPRGKRRAHGKAAALGAQRCYMRARPATVSPPSTADEETLSTRVLKRSSGPPSARPCLKIYAEQKSGPSSYPDCEENCENCVVNKVKMASTRSKTRLRECNTAEESTIADSG